MEELIVVIPVGDAYTVGDFADVYVNDVKQNQSPVAFFPGTAPGPGYGEGSYGESPPFGDGTPRAGYGDGVYGSGGYGRPARALTVRTAPLYYGHKEIRVEVFDYLGNASPGDAVEEAVLLMTGPSAPKNLRFSSQTGAGPVTFAFDPSVELAA